MPRAAARFEDVFTDFVTSLGGVYAETVGAERGNLLRHFNAGYRAAWSYQGVAWEDTWQEGAVAVAAGVIDFATLNDAHVFNLWSADPRLGNACWIDGTTTQEGVYVGDAWSANGVFGFWRPVCPQFDGTDEDAPMIAILTDATIAFAQAEHWRGAGQYQTGGQRRADAKELCEELAAVEFPRLQTKWWLRRKE